MKGCWEDSVRSFKTHLQKISSAQKSTFMEFITMLTKLT